MDFPKKLWVVPPRAATSLTAGRWTSTKWLHFVLMSSLILNGLEPDLAAGDQAGFRDRFTRIDREIQMLKQEILEVNQELLLLEEALLYPPRQQLVVFLSVTTDTPVAVNHLKIELDGEPVVHHAYTASEIAALQKGGVHRPYVGKLRKGDHSFEAFVSGTGRKGRAFHKRSIKQFAKERGPKYIELRIEGTKYKNEPEFGVYEW